MRASGLAAAHHQRQLQLLHFPYQRDMVEWVLVNIYGPPHAYVVLVDRHDANALLPREVRVKGSRGPWFLDK